MTTLILSKQELRVLKTIAKQHKVTLPEAVKILIRESAKTPKPEAQQCSN